MGEYFGKKAFASLHGAAILRPQTEEDRVSLENQTRDLQQQARYRKPNVQRRPTRVTIDVNVEFVDVFSEDTTQDSVWVFNVLELLAVHCRNNLPEMRTIEIWCDNAANYHNAEVARFSPLIWHQYGFGLTSLRFFEPGEGKSLLDRHFATVKHAIRKRVSSGLNFERINDLREVIEHYHLYMHTNSLQIETQSNLFLHGKFLKYRHIMTGDINIKMVMFCCKCTERCTIKEHQSQPAIRNCCRIFLYHRI